MPDLYWVDGTESSKVNDMDYLQTAELWVREIFVELDVTRVDVPGGHMKSDGSQQSGTGELFQPNHDTWV